jgi:hypothetical protein
LAGLDVEEAADSPFLPSDSHGNFRAIIAHLD